jgi:TrmH family RNA methyltransferase
VTSVEPQFISSRENALLKDLRRLAQDSTAYRKQQKVWIEGDHLAVAALARACQPALAVFRESAWPQAPRVGRGAGAAAKTVLVADALFAASADWSRLRPWLSSSTCRPHRHWTRGRPA